MSETALLPAETESTLSWELKQLSPLHKQAAALLAQGTSRDVIAQHCGWTKEYVTHLGRQPLFQAYIKEMSALVAVRLEALFEKSVDTISEAMDQGNIDEKLKGAKLQLEATGRIGRFQTEVPVGGGEDRLLALSERLVELLHKQRRRIIDVESTEVIVQN